MGGLTRFAGSESKYAPTWVASLASLVRKANMHPVRPKAALCTFSNNFLILNLFAPKSSNHYNFFGCPNLQTTFFRELILTRGCPTISYGNINTRTGACRCLRRALPAGACGARFPKLMSPTPLHSVHVYVHFGDFSKKK